MTRKENNLIRTAGREILVLLIMTCLICLSAGRTVHAAESGSETATSVLPPKKIVSIVFDDSGSMGDDWLDENYAVQVFAALLNPQDELYVTYMSELTADRIDLNDPDAAVKKIRDKKMADGGTPLTAVDVACDALEGIRGEDPATQFWLVIMTDGGFGRYDSRYADLDDALNQLKGKAQSNGSKLRVYYFGIGASAATVSPDPSNGLEARQSDDIVGTLGEIAGAVSGRCIFEKNEIEVIDRRSIRIRSNLPLYSMSAFTQNSTAKVESVEAADAETPDDGLSVRNIHVDRPDLYLPDNVKEKKAGLRGNVSVISGKNDILPPGAYTISFTGDIDVDKLVLMYQPAIRLELQLTAHGNEITDPAQIHENEDVEVEIRPVDPSSGEEIDMDSFPQDTGWEIRISRDGTEQLQEGRTADLQDLAHVEYRIRGAMTIPGMPAVYTREIAFTPTDDPRAYSLEADKDTGTIPRAKLMSGENADSSPAVRVMRDEDLDRDGVPDGNPRPLTKEETVGKKAAVEKEVRIEADDFGFLPNRLGFLQAGLSLRQRSDGAYVLCPDIGGTRGTMLTLLAPYAIRTGHYHVTVELPVNGQTEELHADVTGRLTDWIPLLVEIFLLWLLYRLWYMIFKKQKFARNCALDLSVYIRDPDGYGSASPDQNEQITLKPYGEHPFSKKPAQIRVRTLQITVFANATGMPCVETNTVYRGGSWGVSTVREGRRGIRFDKVVETIRTQTKKREKGESDEPEMHILTSEPTYFYEGGTQLYTLSLIQR